ncbi:MAG: DUF2336 domain-containing protein [Pseudorhodoplanes sp.]|nr:hypothetical protein [Pseudorhodoplanes sp.]MBW7948848.1 DUF2336 domain-containing protein [Pseudorhodoplanes sp.]
MPPVASLIPELEEVLQHGSPEKHGDVLRQITTLFLQSAPRFNEDHIRLFDDVFGRLIEEIEAKARAELSRRLAPIANAPTEIIRRLAEDDDIMIAGPILAKSPRLADADILSIARSKGQSHLYAISARESLTESITDILVSRGDQEVVRKMAENPGARLSDTGYARLVKRAERDSALAESVAQRADIPAYLFRELVLRATEVVQRRLLAAARPETQAEIRRVLTKVSSEVGAGMPADRDFSAALADIDRLVAAGTLDQACLIEHAGKGRYEHTAVALAKLCAVPLEVVDKLMYGERPDPILILCKANGFSWSTARALILVRPGTRGKSSATLDEAQANFERLSPATAQRVVRFWQAGHGRAAEGVSPAG